MDHAMNIRKALIESAGKAPTAEQNVDAAIKHYACRLAEKRVKALRYIGNRWVLHPNYNAKANQHHNPWHKSSAVLSAYLHFSGAIARGRV